MAWLAANLVNIVLSAVIVLVVGLIVRGMVRDKKAGKCSCGGDCAGCGICSAAAGLPKTMDELRKQQ